MKISGRLVKNLAPITGAILFSVALLAMHSILRDYHYRDVALALRALPAANIVFAILLTGLGYLTLTCYDALAFYYVKRSLPYHRTALASFIGYAFSNSIGLSFLSGGSVRYRLYSSWSISPMEIARIVLFCTVTGWLGFFSLGGAAFLLEPTSIPESFHVPGLVAHFAGVLFITPVAVYLFACATFRKVITLRGHEFGLPPIHLALCQIAVACVDLAIAGTVLYILMPSDLTLSYPAFLGVYLVAVVSGVLSQAPGGIGVFEAIITLVLSHYAPEPSIVGSLVAFRAIYYLLPLIAAGGLLGGYELHRRREHVSRLAGVVGPWIPAVVPRLFAILAFVGGIVLLFSNATPAIHGRLGFVYRFLPLQAIEFSHFSASLIGVGLLFLARGVERRLDAAYFLLVLFLGLGAVFSLLKGFDYEEAAVLTAMMIVLIPCHSYFDRKASLLSQPLTGGWILSIACVLVCSLWLGFFSHKHSGYSSDLWWRFSLRGDAPRFLRATVGVAVVVMGYGLARLLRPSSPGPRMTCATDLEKAYEIVKRSPFASANLALLGDKMLLINEREDAFIMYGVEGRSWVAMGDPVGPQDSAKELVWRFCDLCDSHGAWPVFYQVQPESLTLYLDLGFSLVKLGEEARVPLATFSVDGNEHKNQRNIINKIDKGGCSFEIISPETVPNVMGRLKEVSDHWMKTKNTREKGFSLGFFSEDYLKRFPMALVRKDGEVQAFANLWVTADKEELSVDLMRYTPEAPHSVMEYLFLKLMLWGRDQGYRFFNLGMAPLSGLETRALSPLWNRVGALVFRYGEHFYNFQGLRQYKEKFDPIWKPKYLAFPGGLALPVILTNIATLVSGGVKGIVAK